MKKFLFGVLVILCWTAGGSLPGQVPFSPQAEKLANAILDGKLAGDKLDCHATPQKPFFDFSFRFELGYVIDCPYRDFNGEADSLVAVARVRPAGGRAVILGDVFEVPALPAEMRGKIDINKFKGDLEFSGAIGLGEGEYEVDLLVADQHNRYFLKSWKTRAERKGSEKKAEISLQPEQVAPLLITDTGDHPAVKTDIHLAILLNAAPIFPFSRRLRAWDRAFLIGSVSSLMRQVPEASVRLVAFNIDQQKVVYRTESLDRAGLEKLAAGLRELELGTISYATLSRPEGWLELLSRIVSDESAPAKRTDAVVFLGPLIRRGDKVPKEMLTCGTEGGPRFFYLQYQAFAANQYPDTIHHLTKDCKGRVLEFHSPGELGAAIAKLRDSLMSSK